jgi:hypothetical protein
VSEARSVPPIRRSVRECRETLGPPVWPNGAQDSVRSPRVESRGVSRERTRYGCTQIVSGGRSRSDASRVLLPALRRAKALARRKLETPPDAGLEPVEGETVREKALTVERRRWFRLAGFGPQVLGTTEGVLGLSPV